jgi:hypothetical protein
MSGPASDESATPRVILVEDGGAFEVFDVLGLADGVLRVRTAYLFEVGEELRVKIEQDGSVTEASARVRAHLGSDELKVTELELSDQTEPRRLVTG